MTTDKVLFVSDTSDGQNWGCHATSRILRNLINERYNVVDTLFLNDIQISGNSLILPDLDDVRYLINEYSNIFTESGNTIGKLYKNGVLSNRHIFDYLPKTSEQFDRRSEIFLKNGEMSQLSDSISEIDHVIINAEGSVHDVGVSNYRSRSWTLLFIAYLFKKIGKNVHIVNHTLDVKSERFKSIVELVYPCLDSIVFRDPISTEKHQAKLGQESVIQSADCAWLIDTHLTEDELNQAIDSGAIDLWHPDKKRCEFNFTEQYISIGLGSGFHQTEYDVCQEFSNLIEDIKCRIDDVNILLTAASSESERSMLEISENTSLPLLKTDSNYSVASSIIGNSELYLGGRWHVSIFGLVGGSRLVNFSGNTFKIEALKQHVDGEYPVYNCEDIVDRKEAIVDSVLKQISYKTPILKDEKRKEMKNLVYNNIKNINNI